MNLIVCDGKFKFHVRFLAGRILSVCVNFWVGKLPLHLNFEHDSIRHSGDVHIHMTSPGWGTLPDTPGGVCISVLRNWY